MESVIFQDTPLAEYLEGEGNAEHEWASANSATEPSTPATIPFAPTGLPAPYSKFRRKLPSALKLEVPSSRGAVARLHNTCSSAINSRLGRSENAHFLEKFRYTIVASQLLSDHANPTSYNPLSANQGPLKDSPQNGENNTLGFSWIGLCSTVLSAFAVVWLIHWVRIVIQASNSRWVICLAYSLIGITLFALYAFVRRQWLKYLRTQAVDSASQLITNAQTLDAATSTATTLIQEVELVSRGYRLSTPLPPVSRLEGQSQTRRCARLRRTLASAISSMIAPYTEACETLRPHAAEVDFEKYCDIYEISQTDIQDAAELMAGGGTECEDAESLKVLKFGLQKLHLLRKLFFCNLLALDADGGKPDFTRWKAAIDTMQLLSSRSFDAAVSLDRILSEEERITLPPTPKNPVTPGRERMRAQMRKLGSLSQGIRGLQAKLHILREESDKTLNESDDISDLGSNLMAQYESIGADLKSLMHEWEDGKSALAVNIDKHERRISLSSAGMLMSRSSTPSLGGLTAVGGSPTDALKILNGEGRSGSSMEATSSDEEVFEAIALPRQRSTLTREERMAKMKEDRMRYAITKEKADASTHMLKELETVIKLRPRGRTTGRMTSV